MKKIKLIKILVSLIGVLSPFAILILGYMTRDVFTVDSIWNGYQTIYNLLLIGLGVFIPFVCYVYAFIILEE